MFDTNEARSPTEEATSTIEEATSKSGSSVLLFIFSAKDKTNKINQGPLNIWKEHSNCQIHSRGDSKTLIALLDFLMKSFFYSYKS